MKNLLMTGKYLGRRCAAWFVFGVLMTIAVAGQMQLDKVALANLMIESTVNGDYSLAVKDCDEAIAEKPNRADAYAVRARAYILWGKDDLAERDANKALSLNPNEPVALNTRALVKKERKDYDGAIADLTAAAAADPKAFKAFYNRALIYEIQKKDELAVADLTKAISVAKTEDQPRIIKERAHIYENERKFAWAISDLSDAVRLSPKDADLYGRRGNDYLNLYQNDLAVADYQKSLQLDADNNSVKSNLAMALARQKYLKAGTVVNDAAATAAHDAGSKAYNQKDYSAAIKSYTDCIAANPVANICYADRADAERKLEKYDEAIADYNVAVELYTNDSKSFSGRGLTFFKKKDYDSAIKDYDRAIVLTQTNAYYYLNRAAAYANLGKPADGEADIKKALQMSPNDQTIKTAYDQIEAQLHPTERRVIDGGADTEELSTGKEYFDRGLEQFNKKEYEKSVNSYSGCIKLEPTNYSCYYNRAIVYDNWGKFAEALADVNKTLEIEPTYAPALDAEPKIKLRLTQANSDDSTKTEYAKYRNEYGRLSDLDAKLNNEMIAEYKKRTGADLDTDHPSAINAAQKIMLCSYLVKMKPLEEQIAQQKEKLKQIKSAGKLANLLDLAKDLKNLEDDEAYDPQLVLMLYEPLGCHQP